MLSKNELEEFYSRMEDFGMASLGKRLLDIVERGGEEMYSALFGDKDAISVYTDLFPLLLEAYGVTASGIVRAVQLSCVVVYQLGYERGKQAGMLSAIFETVPKEEGGEA